MVKISFWITTSLIFYTYFIYPLILLILSRLIKKGDFEKNSEFFPSVSMIIPAYNEEAIIEAKIKNCLELNYPHDKLEVIIGSDGSTDNTINIIERYASSSTHLFKFQERKGKINVLNCLVPKSRGEIIIFSDANTIYERSAIRELVKHFANLKIGCVCGRLKLKRAGKSRGGEWEGIYWNYETFIKSLEGEMGFLLGANGGIYAIRKELFKPLPENTIVEDFIIPMKILEMGFKITYEKNAVGYEEASVSIEDEVIRKTRIGAGDYQALLLASPMLNIFKGMPSFAFWSHKVIRWFVPFLLFLLLGINFLLLRERLYVNIFLLQVIFYSLALLGYVTARIAWRIKLFSIPYYFTAMNISLLAGFFKFVSKTQKVTWQRISR